MNSINESMKNKYIGQIFYTCDTNKAFEIIDYGKDQDDITIKMLDDNFIKKVSMRKIRYGIRESYIRTNIKPILFKSKNDEYKNSIFKTSCGDYLLITEYISYSNVYYKFLDDFGYEGHTALYNIIKGTVQNPYHKNKFGGYIGEGIYNSHKYSWLYSKWMNILIRGCENNDFYHSYRNDYNKYDFTLICDEWKCYNIFADWFMRTHSLLNPDIKYDIDKDLYYPIYKSTYCGFKIYSPDTCALIPHEINVLLEFNAIQRNFKDKNEIFNVYDKLCNAADYYFGIGALLEKDYKYIKNIDIKSYYELLFENPIS